MTGRIPLDDLTSDQLDALYDRLDFHEQTTLPTLHRRIESDAETIQRWRGRAESAELRAGQTEAALDRVRVWADGPCPTRPKGYEITGDRASGYVQAMDEIAQLLAGHGPIAALDQAQQPTT